ncbi:PucR family transcriptional regulator ligand-binding domain-containing protein [Mycobacterium sp. CPCC 205372]|uniref:PucR family transcriptional regulator ligand-binding domain-containing protein n=1 Tax=Mycobacterium hippophais TaxID=3016340 RepID=A0ABT4Q095_9MYCO|nr:PucR family transcriptional regulator [Mycobacterium hippophais]MCZ8382255.1 PucR family transcriptional regulator ligand-binding domain-containing protein [Mycobacterium hippophais]
MDTPDATTPNASETLTLGELLNDGVLAGAELVAGGSRLDRAISAVNVMTVPDIGRWVRKDEFLLATGYPLPRDGEDQGRLLTDLHGLGIAGIGIKLDRYMPELSQAMIDAAEHIGLPLVVIPESIRFDDILSRAFGIIVNRQASALERAQEIHHSFLAITLSGGGLNELAGSLSSLLGDAGVAITDRHGAVLAHAGDQTLLADVELVDAESADVLRLGPTGSHTHGTTGKHWASSEIRAGRLHHGFVVAVESDRPFGEFSMVAVGQAAIVAALEVTRDLAVTAVERRFSSNALFELISGADTQSDDYASLGSGFGWNLERDIVVLVGRREGAADEARPTKRRSRLADDRAVEFWASAVRSRDRMAAAAGLGSELVAVIGADQDVLTVAHAVQDEVARFTHSQYAIGVSRPYPGPAEVSTAYQEARTALRLGPRVSGTGAVTAYGELGLFRLLAQVGDDELQTFAEETLGPVLRMSEPERSEMFQTLETLIKHNMNMAEAARNLHFHYNTLRYRLAKLERLLGPFSTSTPLAIQIGIALQITEMQRILAQRPR